ncbi:MAG: winged helix-turn-helix domain-containing protein, partial [Betaproteobacteria bacterium]
MPTSSTSSTPTNVPTVPAAPSSTTPNLSNEPSHFEFGPDMHPGIYRLDIASRSLFRSGEFVPLAPKVAETLLLLVEHAGRVVSKEQLLARVWPGVIVEEGVIANCISTLRKQLKTDFDEPGPIATVAKRGYRFTTSVRSAQATAPEKSVSPTAAVRPPPPATHATRERVPVQPGAAAPAKNPQARTLITQREKILVADIENKTGDPIFDETIKQALMLNLAQSPLLDIITDRKVHSMLVMMEWQGQPVVGEVALEICQRTGTRAAITGSIFSLGDDFAIGLYAIDGETGNILVSEQSRAKGMGEVLQAIDRASLGLREKLGESLASVKRHSLRFDEVATSSLNALRAYSLGRRQWLEHGEASAITQFLLAIELDPQFVSTYSALALCCSNMGDSAKADVYMTKAYELRDRATENERGRIQGIYHLVVTGDVYKGLDAYRAWLDARPENGSIAHTNSGHFYAMLGQWEKARDHAERGMALERTAVVAGNLATAQMALGEFNAARDTLDDTLAEGIDAFSIHLNAYLCAFLLNDAAGMRKHFDAVMGRPGEEDFLLAAQADTEAYYGHFIRSRELSTRAVESARQSGADEMSAIWQAQAALREAEIGNHELARSGALAALDICAGRQVESVVALTFARAGDFERAAAMAQKLESEHRQGTQIQRYWVPCILAAIELHRRDYRAAIKALENAVGVDLALSLPF